jgi:hypothetical protein
LIGREGIAFEGHAFLRIGGNHAAEGFATVEIFGREAFLGGIAFVGEALEGVDAVAAFGFFGAVAGEAVVEEDGGEVALKAEVVGGAYADCV